MQTTVKVGNNLERIGDAGTHIAKRVRIMRRERVTPSPFDIAEIEGIALGAARESTQSFLGRDLDLARRACQREPEFDARYVVYITRLRDEMVADPSRVPYLLFTQSVLKYLEKVADYSLNIGEQAIFLLTGRRLKFSQYEQLDRLVGETADSPGGERHYWDGISGAVVVRVDGQGTPAIYKEGSRRKIQAEAEKLEAWQRIASDMTPRVLSSVTVKDRQALLREFVEGILLSDFYATPASRDAKLAATHSLLGCLNVVWRKTLTPQVAAIDYVKQIRQRLPDVYALHPDLIAVARVGLKVGERWVGIEDLLTQAEALEARLAPPFSVWLHGDLNVNNVFYDTATGSIKFIDVHRSHLGDFLQDVGVFLVSLDRRADLAPARHPDMAAVGDAVLAFAGTFAREFGDTAYDQRLRLSIARSCLTSSRIVVNPELAHGLLRRGMALLFELVNGA